MNKKKSVHYSIYVVLLEDCIGKFRKVKDENPRRDTEKPCVYVGMTGLDVMKRFENHKAGYVKKYGIRLMPELYEDLNPLSYDEAVIAEQGLARRLRAEGYTVVGGH